MADGNHASYAKVGFALFLGTIAIAGTLCWLGGIGDRSREFLVETYYDDPVGGLAVGGAVNFRGVKIGEVRSIGFTRAAYSAADVADFQRVRIVMALDGAKFGAGGEGSAERIVREAVAHGMRATVTLGGITGIAKIEFGIHENPAPVAELNWKPKYPLIPPQPSLLNSFSRSATQVLDRFNKTDFGGVWSNIQLTAQSAASFAQRMDGLVEAEREGIDQTLRRFDELVTTLSDFAVQIKENPSLLFFATEPRRLPETAR